MGLLDYIRDPKTTKATTGTANASTGPVDAVELKRDMTVPGVADHGCLIVITDKQGRPRAVTFNGRGLPFLSMPADEKTIKAWHDHWYGVQLQGTITSIKLLAPRLFGRKP